MHTNGRERGESQTRYQSRKSSGVKTVCRWFGAPPCATKRLAPLSQSAEETGLNPVRSRFESGEGYVRFYACLAERYTRRTQNAVPVRECGFDSHDRYGEVGLKCSGTTNTAGRAPRAAEACRREVVPKWEDARTSRRAPHTKSLTRLCSSVGTSAPLKRERSAVRPRPKARSNNGESRIQVLQPVSKAGASRKRWGSSPRLSALD